VDCIPERVRDFGLAVGDAGDFANQLLASHIQERGKRQIESAHSFLIQLEQQVGGLDEKPGWALRSSRIRPGLKTTW